MPTNQELSDELESLTKTTAKAIGIIYDIASTHGNSRNQLNYKALEQAVSEIRSDIRRAELLIQE